MSTDMSFPGETSIVDKLRNSEDDHIDRLLHFGLSANQYPDPLAMLSNVAAQSCSSCVLLQFASFVLLVYHSPGHIVVAELLEHRAQPGEPTLYLDVRPTIDAQTACCGVAAC